MKEKQKKQSSILCISFEADALKHNAPSNHTFELSHAFSKAGHKTVLVTDGTHRQNSDRNFTHVTANDHEVSGTLLHKIVIAVKKNIDFYRVAKHYAKKCDLIYERQNTIGIAGLALALRYRKPLFYEVNSLNAEEALSVHGFTNEGLYKIFNLWMRIQLKRAKANFVQTSELQKLIKKIYFVNNVFVVPNGARLATQNPKVITKQRPLSCIYVGTIDQYHSLVSILDIFSHLEEIAEISVIGSGPSLDYLENRYASANIKFCGSLTHQKALSAMRKADVGVAHYNLKSPLFKKFGFYFCPIKLLEYSANGLPTILLGQSNSVIKKFESAGACRVVKNSSQLEQAIMELYETPLQITAMSNQALATARQFSWDGAAERTLEVLNA